MGQTNGMRPTRLRVTNYRGLKALDENIGEKGALFKGENAAGKTSALSAVRSALDARDIHPDAIRLRIAPGRGWCLGASRMQRSDGGTLRW